MEPLSVNDPHAVGEFQLRARLGAGGMGRVYLGFSPAGRAVAVKVVHSELARDAEFRRRFGREVAAARAVGGMYTAPVVAAGLDDDPPWLATAYVPGPPLADVVARHGALPELAVWRLAAGLAEALRAVHACGLVHRDLKPANVLLAADGPHVIDFGISRAFDGTQLTAVGMVVGTPGYMSPEQAEGTLVGPASDVFSLGCVLAFAASGNAPFGGGSAASVLYRVVTGQPDLTAVPEKLRQVISACLAKDPAQRLELTALGAMITRAGPAVTATPTSFWPAEVAEVIASATASPASLNPTGAGPASPVPGVAAGASVAGAGLPGAGPAGAGVMGAGPGAAGASGPAATGAAATGAAVAGASGSAAAAAARPGSASLGTAAPGTAHGAPGPAGMVPDGYYAAATASMAARRPNGTMAPGGQGTPGWGGGGPGAPGGPGGPGAPGGPPRSPSAGPMAPWPQAPRPDPLSRYTPAPQNPWRPTSVVTAIWLMYGGAVLTVVGLFVDLTVISQLRAAYLTDHPLLGQSGIDRINRLAGAGDLAVIIGCVIGVSLWVALAMATNRGRGWTRTVGTVLFGIDTLVFIATIGRPGISAIKTIHLLIWLVGLVAVVMLWQRQASQFFAAHRRR
jgi:Protein kinase domain